MASVNKIIKSILNVNDVVIDNASLDLNERKKRFLRYIYIPKKRRWQDVLFAVVNAQFMIEHQKKECGVD